MHKETKIRRAVMKVKKQRGDNQSSLADALSYLGISKPTYFRWKSMIKGWDLEIQDAEQKAKAEAKHQALSTRYKNPPPAVKDSNTKSKKAVEEEEETRKDLLRTIGVDNPFDPPRWFDDIEEADQFDDGRDDDDYEDVSIF